MLIWFILVHWFWFNPNSTVITAAGPQVKVNVETNFSNSCITLHPEAIKQNTFLLPYFHFALLFCHFLCFAQMLEFHSVKDAMHIKCKYDILHIEVSSRQTNKLNVHIEY